MMYRPNSYQCGFGRANRDPLDLIERDLVAVPVVELGGPRPFVGGDGLGVLHSAAVLEVGGHAGGPEGDSFR